MKELSHIFQGDRITIYHWFNRWESRRLAGLYDRAGKGRTPIFHQEQREQIRQWSKLSPKNLHQVIALMQNEVALKASKSTMKRLWKIGQLTWRRIRRTVRGHPDPALYHERKEALEILMEEAKQGIIDLRYDDASGFCLVPYMPYAWQEQGETIALESGNSKRLHV